MDKVPKPWYADLTRYHWFVLAICTMGWMFDCLDQQLFALARSPAIAELLTVSETAPDVAKYTGYATSIMLIGWATGGIIFGVMGDKLGRARTMVFTILCYSVFTGLCGLSQTVWQFVLLRFLTGLGVGGQFAVGVSLVAETMPDRARPRALGLLQALSAVGNISAALIAMGFGFLETSDALPHSAWRWMFVVGVFPAFLAIIVIRHLKEPERWQKAVGDQAEAKHHAGSIRELFGDPRWRRRVILGMLLASAGVIGLWGIGFFSIDLNRSVFRKIAETHARESGQTEVDRQLVGMVLRSPELLDKVKDRINPRDLLGSDAGNGDPRLLFAEALRLHESGTPVSPEAVLDALDQPNDHRPAQTADQRDRLAEYLEGPAGNADALSGLVEQIADRKKEINGVVSQWGSLTSMLFNIGAFFGIYAFAVVTDRLGRRWTFVLFFFAAMVSTGVAFMCMDTKTEVFWMVPLMGFCQLSVFGGYAIYFPELFPTRLRSTAVSFCYNIGRYVAALGPSALGLLTSEVFTPERGFAEPMRWAGLTMCSIFLLGIVVVLFAPETKDQPLPE